MNLMFDILGIQQDERSQHIMKLVAICRVQQVQASMVVLRVLAHFMLAALLYKGSQLEHLGVKSWHADDCGLFSSYWKTDLPVSSPQCERLYTILSEHEWQPTLFLCSFVVVSSAFPKRLSARGLDMWHVVFCCAWASRRIQISQE